MTLHYSDFPELVISTLFVRRSLDCKWWRYKEFMRKLSNVVTAHLPSLFRSVPLQFPRPPSEDEFFFSRIPSSAGRRMQAERARAEDKKVKRGRSNLIWWARVRKGGVLSLFFPNLKKGEYPRNEKRWGPL